MKASKELIETSWYCEMSWLCARLWILPALGLQLACWVFYWRRNDYKISVKGMATVKVVSLMGFSNKQLNQQMQMWLDSNIFFILPFLLFLMELTTSGKNFALFESQNCYGRGCVQKIKIHSPTRHLTFSLVSWVNPMGWFLKRSLFIRVLDRDQPSAIKSEAKSRFS